MDKAEGYKKEISFLISPEEYQNEAIEIIRKIKSPEILKLIYCFVKSSYKEERAGSE